MPTQKKVTPDQVTAWKNDLFSGKSLKVTAPELRNWPLSHYLWAAVFQAKDLHDLRDDFDSNWQTPAWNFGRFAKAHPDLVNLGEDQALRLVKNTIGSKFWEEHLDMDIADAEMAFDDIWVKCRAIPGYDPLTVAVMEAKGAPSIDDDGSPAGYQMFLNVARSMKRQLNDEPFFLPCHKLAPLMGCTPMTVSRYRQKAIRTGLLKVIKEHSFRSSVKGEATEFLFLG